MSIKDEIRELDRKIASMKKLNAKHRQTATVQIPTTGELYVMTRVCPLRALLALIIVYLPIIWHAWWSGHEICVHDDDQGFTKLFCECGYGNDGRTANRELYLTRKGKI